MDDEPLRTPKTPEELQLQAEIGMRLKVARNAAGLTLDQAGETVALGKAAMSLWEQGKRGMDVVKIAALAQLYGVTSDSLLFGGPSVTITKAAQALGRDFDMLPQEDRKLILEIVQDRLARQKGTPGKGRAA